MNKQEWLVGVVGFLLGVVLTILLGGSYYSAHHNGSGMRGMFNMMGGDNETTSQSCSNTSCSGGH